MRTVLRGIGLGLVVVLTLIAYPATASAAPVGVRTIEITTTPPTPQARFMIDGRALVTDAQGRARATVVRSKAAHRVELTTPTVTAGGQVSKFARWHGQDDSDPGYNPVLAGMPVDHNLRLRVAFEVSQVIGFDFVDQAHKPVDPARITSITLRSDTGQTSTLAPPAAVSLVAVRPSVGAGQLVARDAVYSVQSVMIDGANVVNVGEQRFRPSLVNGPLPVVVLLRSAHFRVVDRLLGTPIATDILLTLPDGTVRRQPTDAGGELVVNDLARGTYRFTATGQAYAVDQQVALSRSQYVDVSVLSYTDAVVLLAGALQMLVGLLALGSRRASTMRSGVVRALPQRPVPGGAEEPDLPAAPVAGEVLEELPDEDLERADA